MKCAVLTFARYYGIFAGIFFAALLVPDYPAAQQNCETAEKPALWKREIALGYTSLSGNTRGSTITSELRADWKNEKKEFNLRTNTFYSSSDRSMQGQKWYVMTRYGMIIWGKKNFNYYKLETDHDKFAAINYRLIPSTGLGYWFVDNDCWKLMTEIGFGYTYTNYNNGAKSTREATVVTRFFAERRLIGESRLIEDVTVYPSLESKGRYRVHSDTSISNPINKRLLLKVSFIDDYNSEPALNRKKNDIQLISSLNLSF